MSASDLSDQLQASYDINSTDDFYDINSQTKKFYLKTSQTYHLSVLTMIVASLGLMAILSSRYNSQNKDSYDSIIFGAY